MAQCEVFPIRYIIELLNKQSRIVLTGMLSIQLALSLVWLTLILKCMQGFRLVVC